MHHAYLRRFSYVIIYCNTVYFLSPNGALVRYSYVPRHIIYNNIIYKLLSSGNGLSRSVFHSVKLSIEQYFFNVWLGLAGLEMSSRFFRPTIYLRYFSKVAANNHVGGRPIDLSALWILVIRFRPNAPRIAIFQYWYCLVLMWKLCWGGHNDNINT